VDQQNGYDSRYTFSAKEKDDETQYSYFGARYYDSDLSVWLSVDPMSDKYPNLSPYTYCANNPVMLVDPDGNEIVDENGETISIELKFKKDGTAKAKYSSNADKATKTIINATLKTPEGVSAVIGAVNVETKIRFKLTDEILENNDHATTKTDGELTENGLYKNITITVSTAKTGTEDKPDRFDNAGIEELINAGTVHEINENLDPMQVWRHTKFDSDRTSDDRRRESLPIRHEFLSRMQYRSLYPAKADKSDYYQNYRNFLGKRRYEKMYRRSQGHTFN